MLAFHFSELRRSNNASEFFIISTPIDDPSLLGLITQGKFFIPSKFTLVKSFPVIKKPGGVGMPSVFKIFLVKSLFIAIAEGNKPE